MLQIIDTRWREHLAEMDYLREGINLRAMGQQDPLVAWTKEGYDMFGQLMDAIDDDFLKYVMHVEVVEEQQEPDLQQASYLAAEDPVQGTSNVQQALAAHAASSGDPDQVAAAAEPAAEETSVPILKGEHEKTGRNQPCWCGS